VTPDEAERPPADRDDRDDVPHDGRDGGERADAGQRRVARPEPAPEPEPSRRAGRFDPQAEAARRRAEIRRFALAHHPDRGGDPGYFAAGLRALRAGRPLPRAGPPDVEVTVYHRPVGLGIVTAWARRRWTRMRRPPRVR
jgi:hypothetical protein